VKPDSTVTLRTITIGTTEGNDSEVTNGLLPGEVVVMTGVDKLQEGTKVNAQTPGAAAATGSTGGTGSRGSSGATSGTGKKKGK
jgi:multidrug efflux system membrane fusion protein